MTIKERLIRELEEVPEDVAVQLLNFLHLLQSQGQTGQTSAPATQTDRSPFVSIDGFLVNPRDNLNAAIWQVPITAWVRNLFAIIPYIRYIRY